jgi:RNase adaptor protein for sRNA GlmZ degradation
MDNFDLRKYLVEGRIYENQDKTAILIDGTSSSGKSVAAQLLKSIPFFKTTDENQWVQIDSDMFVGMGNDGEKKKTKIRPSQY